MIKIFVDPTGQRIALTNESAVRLDGSIVINTGSDFLLSQGWGLVGKYKGSEI